MSTFQVPCSESAIRGWGVVPTLLWMLTSQLLYVPRAMGPTFLPEGEVNVIWGCGPVPVPAGGSACTTPHWALLTICTLKWRLVQDSLTLNVAWGMPASLLYE